MQKVCSECKLSLDITQFNKNRRRLDGYHEYCKNCRKAQYLRRDKSSAVKRSAQRYATKREECLAQMKKYYESTKQQKQQYGKDHYVKNKALYLANSTLRKAHVKQATPIWFNDDHAFVIREAYRLAILREKMTGIKWDVDHIIPIKGKLVRGLHVMENIAVIPRKLNNAKRARYEIK